MNAPLSPSTAAPADCAVDDTSIDPEISAKLLVLNYARVRLGVVLTGLITLIFFGLLAPFFPFEQGLMWGGILLLTSLARYFLDWIYRRSDSLLSDTRRWAAWSCVGSWGTELKRMSFGDDDRALDLGDDVKSISSENTFLKDTAHRPTLRPK